MAIREHLNLAGAIIPILAILDDWLVNLSSHGTNLILNASAGESGPLVVVPPPCSRKVEIPPADKVSLGILPNAYIDGEYKRY